MAEENKTNAVEAVQALLRQVAEVRQEVSTQKLSLGEHSTDLGEIRASIASLDGEVRGVAARFAEVADIRSQAVGFLKAIEEDARRAHSEAGYAFNAKGMAEQHAKAIAEVQGTVQAAFSGLTSTKASSDELVKLIGIARTAAEADAKSIADAKAAASRNQAQIAAANERVAAVMPAIDQGSKDANAITAAKTGAEASASEIRALQVQVGELSARASSDSGLIAKNEEESKKLVAVMAEAASRANEANTRLEAYEAELAKMRTEFATMQEKLEGLLPHATSAGLASAFHIQKARFSGPQRNWLAVFVMSIIFLLGAAGWGLPAAGDTWDSMLRHFVNRLPIVAPLIWLAVYAGHHYSMALRLEEDYAFKEAVSTAFEGYKREMQGIPARDGSTENPLVTLCENVLRALAERPGRIYDGRADVITPLTPAATVIKDLIAEIQKLREAKPK